MAGEVLQVKEVINPDNFAKQLAGLYNRWLVQRTEKEKEWRELRNYLFATDTTTTTNSKLPWRNKTTIPKLTQIRDNLHANYKDALFPNDDWFRWEGDSTDGVKKQKRKNIQSYMKNKLKKSKFRETISKCLYDYIDYGNAFADVIFVNEGYEDPITKERVVTYIGPKLVRTSPFDIVFNPTAVTFKSSPKFTRYLKSIGELKKEVLTRPELKFTSAVLDKALGVRKALSAFKMEDINKSEGYLADGFGSLQEYYQSGMVELLEFEGDVYDETTGVLKENRIITIIDRSYIIRDIQNPSWLGTDTKEHVGWRDRPDNLYAMGPMDNLVGMQYRLDHLENLKADALDQTILPPKVIVGDVEPFEWGPNVEIHVPEDGDVRILPPNPAAFQVNNEIANLMALMEEMAGAPKEAMGFRTPGEKTAFEVQQLQNSAGRIFQHKINKFEVEFLEPILNTFLEISRRNMVPSDVTMIMDDDLGVADFISLTKEDITSEGKLYPIGARHYAARAQLIQNITGVFNSPIGQMISPHISTKALAAMIEDQMGFSKYALIKDNVAVFEAADTQRLVNQVQKTVGAEDATPVEENMIG